MYTSLLKDPSSPFSVWTQLIPSLSFSQSHLPQSSWSVLLFPAQGHSLANMVIPESMLEIKEARYKRQHTIGFHSQEICVTGKSTETENQSVVV